MGSAPGQGRPASRRSLVWVRGIERSSDQPVNRQCEPSPRWHRLFSNRDGHMDHEKPPVEETKNPEYTPSATPPRH